MNILLLTPPLAFLLLLLVTWGLSKLAKRLSAKGVDTPGKFMSYACGQDVKTGRIQPNYIEFFPMAFFFTIMHVAALTLATVTADSIWLAILFIAVAVLALIILFRRD